MIWLCTYLLFTNFVAFAGFWGCAVCTVMNTFWVFPLYWYIKCWLLLAAFVLADFVIFCIASFQTCICWWILYFVPCGLLLWTKQLCLFLRFVAKLGLWFWHYNFDFDWNNKYESFGLFAWKHDVNSDLNILRYRPWVGLFYAAFGLSWLWCIM